VGGKQNSIHVRASAQAKGHPHMQACAGQAHAAISSSSFLAGRRDVGAHKSPSAQSEAHQKFLISTWLQFCVLGWIGCCVQNIAFRFEGSLDYSGCP